MNSGFFGRLCRLAVTGVILFCSASCIEINEHLGQNFIPDNQKWKVYVPAPQNFKNGDVVMQVSDSLSAYSNRRMTFGAVKDNWGICSKSTSFTLVPVKKDISFGKNWKVRKFHFSAVRDTFSVMNSADMEMLQNVFVHPLKKQLDSTVRYSGEFMNKERLNEYVDFSKRITVGTPLYIGGDSLSFDFSKEYAESLIKGIESIPEDKKDSLIRYLDAVPGIYITTNDPVAEGGRFNMFEVALKTDQYGYVTGNYAELAITADYGDRKDVDTTFLFMYGPADFVTENSTIVPTQFAFNANTQEHISQYASGQEIVADDKITVEGGSGYKPVIKATAIREAVANLIRQELDEPGMEDFSNIVINKATIIMSYDTADLENGWTDVDLYPEILSPTVRLRSTKGKHVTYAGLTDSSIEGANHGDINRSGCKYSPDISHHVQEIMKLDSSSKDYEKEIAKYDIWMLIMHEEVTTTTNNNNNNDFMNNLMYNSYYNNMMYDPYGYGGYYGGGYGYGYGGYGYNNYYNYMMMAQMASGSSTSTEKSTDLDKDRYYKCVLKGTGESVPEEKRPKIKITFSIPGEE